METQITRIPAPFPKISIDVADVSDIDDITEDRIKIEGYQSYPRIQAKMVA